MKKAIEKNKVIICSTGLKVVISIYFIFSIFPSIVFDYSIIYFP